VNFVVAGVTFVAAGVEWVEALTIVLAVGLVRGWRAAFSGTALALVALIAMVAVFGLALAAYLPVVRTLIGVFLLLFGLKWLHKAILRSAGLKALHDEAVAFIATEERLRETRSHWAGVATAFNGVLLEGLEVVFIVVAVGGLNHNNYLSPIAGAAASVAVVVPAAAPGEPGTAVRLLRGAWAEVYGLFVDDSALAVVTVAALLAVALFAQRFNPQLAGLFLVLGVLLAIAVSLSGPARARARK
jgi:Ca2+/H+ antiporter, TMEM165/GDT1 family